MMRHIFAGIVTGAVVAGLAGCAAPAPARADVSAAFLHAILTTTELDDLPAAPAAFRSVADDLTRDAFDGRCGDDAYRTGLSESATRRAWDVVCAAYFPGDMSAGQLRRARAESTAAPAA